MKSHEQLLEAFEDAYFALLMEKVAEEEGNRFEELNQRLQSDPDCAVPETVDRKALQTIERCFARQQQRRVLRTVKRVLHSAAIIIAISVLLVTMAFAISEDFRIAARNLLITENEKYTEFRMEQVEPNETVDQLPSNNKTGAHFKNFEIGWIPDGFYLSDNQYNEWAYYEDGNGQWIQVLFADDHGSVQLDTEGTNITDSTIADLPATIIEKNGQTTVLLTEKDLGFFYTIILSPGIDGETANEIAENLIRF